MSDFEYVMAELKARRVPVPRIAADTGLPAKWLAKVRSGETKNPGAERISTLSRYFRLLEKQRRELMRELANEA